MSVGNSAMKKRNLKAAKLKKVSSPGVLASEVDRVRRLEAKLDALLTKMDADTGIADTDYKSTVDAVE